MGKIMFSLTNSNTHPDGRFHNELSGDTCKHCCKYYPNKFSLDTSS